jgi:hypothetical protein
MDVILRSSDNHYELIISNTEKSTVYTLTKPQQNMCNHVLGLLTAHIDYGVKITKVNTNLVIGDWTFDLTNTRDKINANKILSCIATM